MSRPAVIDDVPIALFCDAYLLLVDVPGLAKTLLVSTLADVLQLQYKRVQFTPELLPGAPDEAVRFVGRVCGSLRLPPRRRDPDDRLAAVCAPTDCLSSATRWRPT